MTIRFAKAKPEDGHDGFFTADNPRVLVKPDEFPKPLYPGDEGFWAHFSEVIQEVSAAKDNANYRSRTAQALIDRGVKTAADAAVAVHKDWPGDLILVAAKACKGKMRDFKKAVPSNFTDGVVLLNHLINAAAWMVSPSSFCAKWNFMVPRPEEVAGAIARDELEAPDWVKLALFRAVPRETLVADQRRFTMYPEGCPPHPSYNAMHAAAAGAGCTVVKVMMDLPPEERAMVDLTASNMAHFRATAGVHYPQDNAVGLWLGQEVVNRWLPDYLEKMVGIPADEVNDALKDAQTDWGAK